jgi:hypothetical protein
VIRAKGGKHPVPHMGLEKMWMVVKVLE